MSSEKEEKKVLSRREALKRFAVLGVGVAASVIVVERAAADRGPASCRYESGGYCSFEK